MGRAEYHPTPSAHFVFDAETWEKLKTQFGPEARDDTSIMGQTGLMGRTPAYLDGCPWNCGEDGEG